MQHLKALNISEETIEVMITNMQKAFEAWDLEFEVIINPTLYEMWEIAKKVDHVLSDRITPPIYEKGGGTGVTNISAIRHLLFRTGFSGLVEFGKYLNKKLNTKRRSENHRELIISRFDYDKIHYPMLDDNRCSASRKMWSLKSEGRDNNGLR